MKLRYFTLACILTSITIIIEAVAAASGEALVFLTVLSALPIYLVSRTYPVYGMISYFCVCILLLTLNPHQMLFFALANGLLGFFLGLFENKKISPVISNLMCGILLCGGVCLSLFLIGSSAVLLSNWYLIALISLFCFIYTIVTHWLLAKAYRKFKVLAKINL